MAHGSGMGSHTGSLLSGPRICRGLTPGRARCPPSPELAAHCDQPDAAAAVLSVVRFMVTSATSNRSLHTDKDHGSFMVLICGVSSDRRVVWRPVFSSLGRFVWWPGRGAVERFSKEGDPDDRAR